jgi:hypothetical protein
MEFEGSFNKICKNIHELNKGFQLIHIVKMIIHYYYCSLEFY